MGTLIPYRVMAAAIAAFFIILDKIRQMNGSVETSTRIIIMSTVYFLCGFYTVYAFYGLESPWYSIVLSIIGGVVAILYYRSTPSPIVQTADVESYIGMSGKVTETLEDKKYVGIFDNGTSIYFSSEKNLSVGDDFTITKIDNNGFIAE